MVIAERVVCVSQNVKDSAFEPWPDDKFSAMEVSGHVSQTEGTTYM